MFNIIVYTKRVILVMMIISCLDIQAQTEIGLEEMYVSRATLIARDIRASASWYKRFLKFVVLEYKPDQHAKLRRGNFQLIIKKGQNTLLIREITFSKGKKYVNGIDKIGFDTNQFDSLKLFLNRYEQKIHTDTYEEKNLKKRTMITLDPEGNKVQIFDVPKKGERFSLDFSFFSINASDYATTLKWYKSHMGFKPIEIVDDSNASFQNFLINGNITLELLHLPFESLETTEFMPVGRDLASFDQLVFSQGLAKKTIYELDNSGNKIVLKR